MMSSPGSIGEREPPFHIWVRVRDRWYDITRDAFESLFGLHIASYLLNCPEVEVTLPDMFRLGLTESVHDANRYRTYLGGEWDIEEITLDPKTSCYSGLDSAAKEKHVILLYSLKIFGAGTSAVHEVRGGQFRFGGRSRILTYMQVDAWCRKNRGRALKMTWSRSSTPTSVTSL